MAGRPGHGRRLHAESRAAALLIVAQIMQVIEVGSTVAGEAYLEAQQHLLAEGDRVRRDLLEDLRPPRFGRRAEAGPAAGGGAQYGHPAAGGRGHIGRKPARGSDLA